MAVESVDSHFFSSKQGCGELATNLRAQSGLEGLLDFGHGGLNLLVVEGLVLVLQDEADGVGLEALGDAFALIDVEEADALEQLLLALQGCLLDLGEGDVLAQDEGQVAAHLGELGHLLVEHFLGGVLLEEQRPVEVGIEDGLLDVHLLQRLAADAADGAQQLLAVALDDVEAFGEELVLRRHHLHATHVDAHAVQDVHDVGLEVEEVGLGGLHLPALGRHVAGHEDANVLGLVEALGDIDDCVIV